MRVLIVDDSAYVLKVIRQMLSRSPFLDVIGAARDGREALEMAEELKPDVITCDLIMPELDGVGFIREQMSRRPIPIVVVSVASESGELVLSALDGGRRFRAKLTRWRLIDPRDLDELIGNGSGGCPPGDGSERVATAMRRPVTPGAVDIVVIGISTGGPQA